MEKIIDFKGKYNWLSNFFFDEKLKIYCTNGILFHSVECAFQASRTNSTGMRKRISEMTSIEAYMFGKRGLIENKKNFNEDKMIIMLNLLEQKFRQEPYRTKLLKTENKEIIYENIYNDTFWGTCRGVGENVLGKTIMNIREHLKEEHKLSLYH